jgi:hypothetical protein
MTYNLTTLRITFCMLVIESVKRPEIDQFCKSSVMRVVVHFKTICSISWLR